eukprot:5060489-Prymnesium_polylepis.1
MQHALGSQFHVANFGQRLTAVSRKEHLDMKTISFWWSYKITPLLSRAWDILVLMFGTNDVGSFSGCSLPCTKWGSQQRTCLKQWREELRPRGLEGCRTNSSCAFVSDYTAFIQRLINSNLQHNASTPLVLLATPPPILFECSRGLNGTLSSVLSPLVQHIADTNRLPPPIDLSTEGFWELQRKE